MIEESFPVSVEAERTVLSGILNGALDASVCLSILTDDDFSLETHRRILRAVRLLVDAGLPMDRVMVYQRAQDSGWHDVTLSALADLDGPALNGLDGYLAVLREKATLRRVARAALQLANRCCTPGEDVRKILADSDRIVRDCQGGLASKQAWLSPGEVMQQLPGGINAFLGSGPTESGIETPWSQLTEMTCGWHAGDLILVAGRPSMGKSVIAMQCAYVAALRGIGVAFFSLEMTATSLIRRLISAVGSIDAQSLRNGHLPREDRIRTARIAGEIAELPIRIDDSRANTIPGILAAVRKLNSALPVGMILIDHMQLMQGIRSYQSKHHELSEISHALKRAAKEFDCPVILLSQLSRTCEQEHRLPVLSDLKETGTLEEDADVVLFVHRPEMYRRTDPTLIGKAEFVVAKQRNGPTGSLGGMRFLHGYQRFEES